MIEWFNNACGRVHLMTMKPYIIWSFLCLTLNVCCQSAKSVNRKNAKNWHWNKDKSFTPNIPLWFYSNVLCRYFSALFQLLALYENMPFFLLGVGLCLCFKLKRLKTSELRTSAWPTWVQVGSLIITFSLTSWRTFMIFRCRPVPLYCCAWQAMSTAEGRYPVNCNKTVVLHSDFVYFLLPKA